MTDRTKRNFTIKSVIAAVLSAAVIFCLPVTFVSAKEPVVVVIDPGHGGYDPGAVVTEDGVEYEEKVFNLKIATALRNELSQYEGVRVYMTREENDVTYMTITARVDYAAQKNADLLISVHNNSSGASARGCLAMVPSLNYNKARSEESIEISSAIINSLKSIGLKSMDPQGKLYDAARGINYPDGSVSDYYGILRNTKIKDITGVLIEYEFMTNTYDLANLRDDGMIAEMGRATAEAIAEHYGLSKGQNTEPVTHIIPQTERVYLHVPAKTFTYGDPPFELSATGGSGTGEYTFDSNTLDIIDVEGNLAYILGPGSTKLFANRNASGEYGPSSCYGSGIQTVKVLPKDVGIKTYYSLYDGLVGLTCSLTGYVEGDLPVGKVEISSDGVTLATQSFSKSDTFSVEISKNDIRNGKIDVRYVPATYDNYNGAAATVTVDEEHEPDVTPTPKDTPVPTAAPTAVPEPTDTPEPTPTNTPVPTPANTPAPTDAPTQTPETDKTPSPAPSEEATAEPAQTPSASPDDGNGNQEEIQKKKEYIILLAVAGTFVLAACILLVALRKEKTK